MLAKRPSLLVSSCALALLVAPAVGRAGRPNTMEACKACHAPADGVVRGKLVSVVPALGSLSVTVGPLVWIVKFGPDVRVKQGDKISGPEALATIPRDREITVAFEGPEAKPVAVEVAVKQPYRVPPEKLLPVEGVKELVSRAGAGERVLLFDSRPPQMFAEGHIPGAISLPYAALREKAAAALPADKNVPIAFYCAGET